MAGQCVLFASALESAAWWACRIAYEPRLSCSLSSDGRQHITCSPSTTCPLVQVWLVCEVFVSIVPLRTAGFSKLLGRAP